MVTRASAVTTRSGIIALCVATIGCRTMPLPDLPDTPTSTSGWFEERGPESVRVSYSAPASSPLASVDRLALRHAAGYALAHGYALFGIDERKVTRGVYVLWTPGNHRVVYSGSYAEWTRYWFWHCVAHGWSNCDVNPLQPWQIKLRKRIEIAYTIRLYRNRMSRWDLIDARLLIELLDRDRNVR